MTLDPQLIPILDQFDNYQVPPLTMLTPEAARNAYAIGRAVDDVMAQHLSSRLHNVAHPVPEQVAAVHHHVMETPTGQVMLRIYYPGERRPYPAVVYFHGGGWVIGSLDKYDASCRALCVAAQCAVVSVGYRQAPEHKFPAAVHDAFAAFCYAREHAAELSLDGARLAIAGESAGGNLAAVTTLRLRDENLPLPVHQLLIYPVISHDFETASYREQATARPLTTAMMRWFWDHYLPSASDGENPYASPLRARSHAGLPWTTIITAGQDPLHDDGRLYADALDHAQVPVTYIHQPGMVHEFFGMGALVGKARETVRLAALHLCQSFADHTEPKAPPHSPLVLAEEEALRQF